MREKTKTTNLAEYDYYPDIDTLHWVWNEKTETAEWEELQKALIEYVEQAEKHKAANHIIDERKQLFVFVPEYQKWIDENISARNIIAGCKRFALIKSEDIFIETAAHQIFNEANSQKILMKDMVNFDDAKKWILENQTNNDE